MRNLRATLIVLLMIISILPYECLAERYFYRRDVPRQRVSLGLTHLLPSAFIIPGGQFVLGTTMGLGLGNVMDVSTNLYLDFSQVFNFSAKASVFQSDLIAAAIFGSYASQSIKVQVADPTLASGIGNREVSSTAFGPGAMVSYRMMSPLLTGHSGIQFMLRSPDLPKSQVKPRTGLIQGHSLHQEFTYGVTPTVAISAGGSYDLTYDIWGVGPSVHIGGFQLGAHFFLNVSEGSVLPILGGSYTSQF